jgi:hypothetical protein
MRLTARLREAVTSQAPGSEGALPRPALRGDRAAQRSQDTSKPVAEDLLEERYQYFALGRTSTAPPRRADGIREARSIAASRSSASRR